MKRILAIATVVALSGCMHYSPLQSEVYDREALRHVSSIYIVETSVHRHELERAIRRELPAIRLASARDDADVLLEYLEIDEMPCYDDCEPQYVRRWFAVMTTPSGHAVSLFQGSASFPLVSRAALFARQLRGYFQPGSESTST